MKAANALNFLLAIALVLMAAKLHRPVFLSDDGIIGGDDGPTAIFFSNPLTRSKETPVQATASTAPAADTSATPAAPAASDAVTTATPSPARDAGAGEAADRRAAAQEGLQPFDVRTAFPANPFDIFTGKGMLLCAGDREKSNAMTIGWGGLGTLWGRNDAVTVYVAEKRYTKAFMDKAAYFTVMAFDKERQAAILEYMGSRSGREGDKAAALGLHLAYTENGTPYYEEAEMVLECEMMYSAPFDPAGMRAVPQKLYSNFPAGVHTMYIGRIVKALKK
jgi:flavin reductase (DIM6/NTAB) family NADH-FMN oxidoreductase RutF